MKVLHITAYVTGGAGIAVKRLHHALLDAGIDSKILCLFALDENISEGIYQFPQSSSFGSRVRKRLKLNRNTRLIEKLSGDFEAFTFPYSPYQLHQHPLVSQADIIHLHWIADFVDLPSFLGVVKKPMVWTAHDLNPILGGFHYEQDVIRNPEFFMLEEKLKKAKHNLINKANIQFIGSSQLTVDKIKEYLPKMKCHMIPCVLDTLNFHAVEKNVARKALNIGESEIILGTGADDLKNYRKGYWLLLEAMKMISEQEKKSIKIISFGASSGPIDQNERYPEYIRFEPVQNKRIHSLIYSAMDFFIIPSIEETFGLTGTEAMLCDTPIISSRTGGMIDYVIENENGYLFEVMDANDLVEKIRKALDSRTTCPMSNIRESIIKWYQLNKPVERHIMLYQSLLV